MRNVDGRYALQLKPIFASLIDIEWHTYRIASWWLAYSPVDEDKRVPTILFNLVQRLSLFGPEIYFRKSLGSHTLGLSHPELAIFSAAIEVPRALGCLPATTTVLGYVLQTT